MDEIRDEIQFNNFQYKCYIVGANICKEETALTYEKICLSVTRLTIFLLEQSGDMMFSTLVLALFNLFCVVSITLPNKEEC